MLPAPPVTQIGVVVPAHDEQELLAACLHALRDAAAQPDLPPVRVVVVADACSDATAAVARDAGADVLEVALRSAGAARRRGLAAIVADTPAPHDGLWLATTDADSRVPTGWFTVQLRLRAQGWDAVAGTVAVDDWSGHDQRVAGSFSAQYAWSGAAHPHVHGANLSLSARAHRAVDGVPALALAEDHALVAALEGAGMRVARWGDDPVVTSARRTPRCEGGFGDLLLTLAAEA